MTSPKVLLTGFQAFLEHATNPTASLVHQFNPPKNVVLETMVLPVDFQQAISPYLNKLQECQPQLILNLGLSATTPVICLEQNALNQYADRTLQQKFSHQIIHPDGEIALSTTLPLDELAEQLCEEGIPTLRSNYAGTYLCNFIYYHSLMWAKQHQATALFLHIPYTTTIASQICGQQKKAYASLPQSLINQAITTIIDHYVATTLPIT